MKLYNQKLADLITANIGDKWITNLETELVNLEKYADDKNFQQAWQKIKYQNKIDLAGIIKECTGIDVNPDSLFGVQVKRIHEYKRQHLNILHIISLYNRIKKDPSVDIVPRTFIFGGKAAPGYFIAKLIIKLVNAVAEIMNNDPDLNNRIKVIYFPNFNVKNGEYIYRAADLSEQISTAGKEASGTGNMKFSLNDALTIGTLDGANIEIRDEVGHENFFLFGLTAHEVQELLRRGYRPRDFYEQNAELRAVLDMMQS